MRLNPGERSVVESVPFLLTLPPSPEDISANCINLPEPSDFAIVKLDSRTAEVDQVFRHHRKRQV